MTPISLKKLDVCLYIAREYIERLPKSAVAEPGWQHVQSRKERGRHTAHDIHSCPTRIFACWLTADMLLSPPAHRAIYLRVPCVAPVSIRFQAAAASPRQGSQLAHGHVSQKEETPYQQLAAVCSLIFWGLSMNPCWWLGLSADSKFEHV